jgi:hypothetical protein
MKLLLVRRTAMVGIVRVVVEVIGGSTMGAKTVVEEELGEVASVRAEDMVIAAAAAERRCARVSSGGGGRRSSRL